MHSEADVAPGAAVVPLPQLAQDDDVEVLSLYVLTGQVMQLGVDAPTANPQPLPTPQAVVQEKSTQALNPVSVTLPSECQDITSPAVTVSPVGAEFPQYFVPAIVK